jgi:hypothetical protein
MFIIFIVAKTFYKMRMPTRREKARRARKARKAILKAKRIACHEAERKAFREAREADRVSRQVEYDSKLKALCEAKSKAIRKEDEEDEKARQAIQDTTKLEQHESTAQEKQLKLFILDVKVFVYLFTLPGRGVGMTDQDAKVAIDVNLVFWHSPFNTYVNHYIICEMFNKDKTESDRKVLQCSKQGKGIFGFWISKDCYLRWVEYIEHHFLAYSEDSTGRFTPSELDLLLKCFNNKHPDNKCTLLV